MKNLNIEIKKICYLKIIKITLIVGLLIISIGMDLALFFRYSKLKEVYENLNEAHQNNTLIEKKLEEINTFYEKYSFLDKEDFDYKFECIEDLDCHKIKLNSKNTKIAIYANTISELNKNIVFLENKGFKINIVLVNREFDKMYFEMEIV